MSIDISSYQEVPYIGAAPQSVAIKNCVPLTRPPGAVVVPIEWASYVPPGVSGVSVRIPLDINVGTQTPLEKIVAVYIDNSNNDYPVFVQFPDTQYGVSISPNSIQWFPVITNAFKINLASDFIPNLVGATRFIFTNIIIDPIEASQLLEVSPEWLGTNPNSTVGATILGRYRRAPALGDALIARTFDSPSGTFTNILNNPDVTDDSIVTYLKEIEVSASSLRALPYATRVFATFRTTWPTSTFTVTSNVWLENNHAKVLHMCNMDVRFTRGMDLLLGTFPAYPTNTVPLLSLRVNIAYTMRSE